MGEGKKGFFAAMTKMDIARVTSGDEIGRVVVGLVVVNMVDRQDFAQKALLLPLRQAAELATVAIAFPNRPLQSTGELRTIRQQGNATTPRRIIRAGIISAANRGDYVLIPFRRPLSQPLANRRAKCVGAKTGESGLGSFDGLFGRQFLASVGTGPGGRRSPAIQWDGFLSCMEPFVPTGLPFIESGSHACPVVSVGEEGLATLFVDRRNHCSASTGTSNGRQGGPLSISLCAKPSLLLSRAQRHDHRLLFHRLSRQGLDGKGELAGCNRKPTNKHAPAISLKGGE